MKDKCYKCHREYQSKDERFCRHCGAKVLWEVICPNKDCHASCDTNSKYCHACGTELIYPE